MIPTPTTPTLTQTHKRTNTQTHKHTDTDLLRPPHSFVIRAQGVSAVGIEIGGVGAPEEHIIQHGIYLEDQ